jgi:hypothetical protein
MGLIKSRRRCARFSVTRLAHHAREHLRLLAIGICSFADAVLNLGVEIRKRPLALLRGGGAVNVMLPSRAGTA